MMKCWVESIVQTSRWASWQGLSLRLVAFLILFIFTRRCAGGRRVVPRPRVLRTAQHWLPGLPHVHRWVHALREPLPVRPPPQRWDRLPHHHLWESVPHCVRDAASRGRRFRRHHSHQRGQGERVECNMRHTFKAILSPTAFPQSVFVYILGYCEMHCTLVFEPIF